MKFEIDLLSAYQHPDVGRAALAALMMVLPDDVVEQTFDEWRATILRETETSSEEDISRETIHEEVVVEPPVVANIEDTLPFEVAPEPAKKPKRKPDGAIAGMDIRALCRLGEQKIGRDKVIEIMQQHGVEKLAGISADKESSLRIDLEGLLA